MIHIFLSYRRKDTADAAGRLSDSLLTKLGEDLVFHDVDDIAIGSEWRKQITKALRKTDVVLALIGPTWLMEADVKGRRRLDNPEDTVRTELELAILLAIPIIPVLIGTTAMPSADDLPDSLKRLYELNAARLRDTDFDYDFDRLFQAIQEYAHQSRTDPFTPRQSARPLPTPVSVEPDGSDPVPGDSPVKRMIPVLVALFFNLLITVPLVLQLSMHRHQIFRISFSFAIATLGWGFLRLLPIRVTPWPTIGTTIAILCAVYFSAPGWLISKQSEDQPPPTVCALISFNAKDYISSKNVCIGCLPYGEDVVTSKGQAGLDNMVEYEVNSADSCEYTFRATLATAESRPVEIWVDDKLVMTDAFRNLTGGFALENQVEQEAWRLLRLSAGSHKLRIYSSGAFPHFLRFRLIPTAGR